jgi:hypothetical protein
MKEKHKIGIFGCAVILGSIFLLIEFLIVKYFY